VVRRSCIFVVTWVVVLLGTACAQAQLQASLRLEKDSLVARGRWNPADSRPDEERPLLPLVEIHCFREQRFCISASASVQAGEPHLAVEYFQILHWTKTGLQAQNDDFSCTINELKIEFQDSKVTATDSPKKPGKNWSEACKTLEHTLSYTLVGERHETAAERNPTR